MRIDGALNDVVRMRSTHDSILKSRTDTNVLRLTLAAKAAAAIVEFLPRPIQVAFFTGGCIVASGMLAAAGIAFLGERQAIKRASRK